MANKYKNIAVLCGEPLDPYSHEILKGAFNASKDMEVNLIVVPGKYYGNDISDFESQFEYQYTSLYSFINGKNVDAAVILTGAIGPFQMIHLQEIISLDLRINSRGFQLFLLLRMLKAGH